METTKTISFTTESGATAIVPEAICKEIADEAAKNAKWELVRTLTKHCANLIIYEELDKIEELTDDELDSLHEMVIERYGSAESIIEDIYRPDCVSDFRGYIKSCLEDIYSGRVKYYTFRIEYSGSFDVVVKAHSEEEAQRFAQDYDDFMSDDAVLDDAEIDDITCTDEDEDEPRWCYNVYDATED